MTIHPSTQTNAGSACQLDHDDFLAGLTFDRAAPAPLRQAAANGDPAEFLNQWTRQLNHRIDPSTPPLPRRAFDWIATDSRLSAAWRRSGPLGRSVRPAILSQPRARSPLGVISRLEPDASDGDLLAALDLLSQPASPSQARRWLTAWRNCITLCTTRALSPELAFTAGVLLAPLKGTAGLRRDGKAALQQELLEHTDTDGTPHAELLDDLPEWLGTLVRARYRGRRFCTSSWNRTARERFDRLVAWTTPLYRHRNRLAMSGRPARGLGELLDAANQLTSSSHRPEVTQSDWARVAVLRTNRSQDAPAVVVTHDGPTPRLDVSVKGRSLLQGDWSIEVTCGSSELALEDWECVCWQSDDDADYIELQADAGHGCRVERQILLSRADELLVLADAAIAGPEMPQEQELACRSSLGLAEGIVAGVARAGRRDWRLAGRGISARVVPLAVPDDPLLATGPASISCHDNRLAWSHQGPGPALYLPLILDFSARRRRRKPDWNSLTVTEDRQVLSPQQAAGFRVRLGDSQLVLYRSLDKPRSPRSVLGQHTQHETVIGLLARDGDFAPLVLVESPPRGTSPPPR